jgi:hypothetical protein
MSRALVIELFIAETVVVIVTRGGSIISSWGAHLKKLRRAEGGANIFGVFRVKIHDFTPKSRLQNFPPTPNLQF